MQSALAFAFALFAAASAYPTFPTVTIQFSNDQSGANADVPIVADGNPNYVSTLFAGTSIDINGEIIATSAQLTQFVQGTSCVITAGGTVIATVNTDKTFTDLDGNPNAAVPTNLSGDIIICEV